VVAPPLVAIEGVHWAKDGPKFASSVDGCDASYTTKYNLVQHLQAHHYVTIESSKPRRPFIREQGSKAQDHVVMNARVLNNPLAHSKQKAITRVKKHTLLEWDRLQVDLQYTLEVPKPKLVRLTFNHIFGFL